MSLNITALLILAIANLAVESIPSPKQALNKIFKWISAISLVGIMTIILTESHNESETVGGYEPRLGIEFRVSLAEKPLIFSTFAIFLHFLLFVDHARSLMIFLLTALTGVFTTNDLFNLFVWFELLLTASFIAPIISKPNFKAVLKYAIPSVIASAMFLIGIGILYKNSGYLNLNEISNSIQNTNQTQIGILFVAIAMLTKAGIVPFHFWLGASYHNFNNIIFPIIYATLTKIGLFALSKVLHKADLTLDPTLSSVMIVLSIVSISSGFILAFFEPNIKRCFAFFSICKSGFLLACLLWSSPSVFYTYLAYDTLFSYFFLISLLTDRNIPSTPIMFGWLGFPISGFFLTNIMLIISSHANPSFVGIYGLFKILALVLLLKIKSMKEETKVSLPDSVFALILIILISAFSVYDFVNG